MWRRRRAVDGLDDDIRDHLEREIEENVARGMSPEEARRQALVKFGNVPLAKEDARAVWVWVWLEQLVRDARYALRSLGRSPAFTAAVVVTLGLGIGGTTAVFSVVDALFLRAPAGVSDPASVRRVFVRRNAGGVTSSDGSGGMWSDARNMRDGSRAFAGIAAYQSPQRIDLGRGKSAARIRASVVSREFFAVLGIRPALGRLFLPEDDGAPGAHPVAVISHAVWQNRFGGADDVLGRTLLINNRPLQIIGVTQRGFHGIDADAVDLWLPAALAAHLGLQSEDGWQASVALSGATRHIARLWSHHSSDRAAAEASAALARAAEAEPVLDPTPEVVLRPIVLAALPGSSWAVDLSLWLLIAAGLVLVISAANVANLLLARGVTRRREFAMRLSLGAGGWRIARQQLTESVALAVLGGAAGLMVAYCGVALLQQFPLPPTAGRIDGRLLAFALAVSLLTALAFGVLPAWRSIQIDPVLVLKGSWAPGALARNRVRLTLVVLQVSLSFTLLVGAALFVRSLTQVSAIRGGADPNRLLTVEVNLTTDTALQASRPYDEFFQLALSRLSTVSGVERAAIVYTPPFEGWGWAVHWRLPGQKTYQNVVTYLNLIGPDYFETAGTRLLRGRAILPTDGPGTEPVAVVNEAMARLLTDDGNLLGQCVDMRAPGLDRVPCLDIVGVVESQRNAYLDPKPVPMIFRAAAQVPQGIPYHSPMLLVRTAGAAAARTQAVHAAVQGLRADLPYVSVAPLAERLQELRPFQLGARLFTLFGLLALLLSAVGLHAVLGYFVAERTSEVGIRRALGAPAIAVMRLVVRQSLVPVIAGLMIGLGTALVGARVLASRLFGIGPHDPISFVSAAACLIAIAALATVLPICRAIRIDPMVALRQD
jgi:predicted permease